METLKTRKLEKEVTRISHPGVQGGESVVWKGMGLVIPPVPPSFLERCNIIDIRYFLKVSSISAIQVLCNMREVIKKKNAIHVFMHARAVYYTYSIIHMFSFGFFFE